METSVAIERVHASLKRCLQHPDFMAQFYTRFFQSSPEVPARFASTDMARQMRMVEASLYTTLLAAEGVPYALKTFADLGNRHYALGIHAGLFDLWRESLVATVADCDPAFDGEVRQAWQAVVQHSASLMLQVYPAT